MKVIELKPIEHWKSFYNKAIVYTDGNFMVLRSYKTAVIALYRGNVYKLWDGYSATTMRHINAFLSTYNLGGGGKKWWSELPMCPSDVREDIKRKMSDISVDIDVPGWAGYCYFS